MSLQGAWRRCRPWIRTLREAVTGEETVLAGGVALFSLLATIPALAALLATYGLIADPRAIAGELRGLNDVLPEEVVTFLTGQIERLARRSHAHLGIALATTLALALWSSRTAARALIVGLNKAYRVVDRRPPLRRFLLSVGVALATLVGFFFLMSVVVALPTILKLLHVRGNPKLITQSLRWPLLLVLVTGGLVALYRHAPSPREHPHGKVWPGAIVATVLWLAVSWVLTMWVDRVEDYEILYGTFASALVLLLWFYASALSILLGGLVNAELERQGLVARKT